MSEQPENKKVYSLLEALESVRRTLTNRYGSPFWVKAEMNKLNRYPHSGHCYPELLEKRQGKVLAQVRGNLWKEDFLRINEQFLKVLKEPLKDGISILFLARITFDPVYGLALRILEIDPVYSLGELEREKQETINRLRLEGIFDANKQVTLAPVPQRIAVISVETSKGYADFRKTIDENQWGYRVFHMLFPSLLQGEKVAESVGHQLERIQLVRHHFDAVAIIRGGGGEIGLAGYNQYNLTRQIALFPLPVITGIGHATNETVAEMVAFRNCITPTDLAIFLIQQFHNFSVPVKEAQRIVSEGSLRLLSDTSKRLTGTAGDFRNLTHHFLHLSARYLTNQAVGLKGVTRVWIRGTRDLLGRESYLLRTGVARVTLSRRDQLHEYRSQFQRHSIRCLKDSSAALEYLGKQVTLLDPTRVLSRGFSITLHKGKALRNTTDVSPGDSLKTLIFDGSIISTVHTIQPGSTHE